MGSSESEMVKTGSRGGGVAFQLNKNSRMVVIAILEVVCLIFSVQLSSLNQIRFPSKEL